MRRVEPNDQGFATISALAVIVILAGLSYLLVDLGYSIKRSSSAALIKAQGVAISDGLIHAAIAEIAAGSVDHRYGGVEIDVDDVPENWRATVIVEVELAKVDINLATRQNLIDVLQTNGAERTIADKIADRILDWRDGDQARRLNGAEANDYKKLGLDYVPRDAPFERIAELKFIPGVSDELFGRMIGILTVHSGNFNATQSAVNEILGGPLGPIALPRPEGFAYTIKSKLIHQSGVELVRTAIVRLTTNPVTPYLVYLWASGVVHD